MERRMGAHTGARRHPPACRRRTMQHCSTDNWPTYPLSIVSRVANCRYFLQFRTLVVCANNLSAAVVSPHAFSHILLLFCLVENDASLVFQKTPCCTTSSFFTRRVVIVAVILCFWFHPCSISHFYQLLTSGPPDFISTVSEMVSLWWWESVYWLPRGVSWEDMNNKTTDPGFMYPHYSHLWMTVITGISLIVSFFPVVLRSICTFFRFIA